MINKDNWVTVCCNRWVPYSDIQLGNVICRSCGKQAQCAMSTN